ncbi:MAG: DNA/RNA non-specific endonuclease [Deltaproteobacteria bacterium]|nr:DNA/RNA non-specific endonuclease [Deltaproteobacteria bacterium]
MKAFCAVFSLVLLICLPITAVYGDYLEVRRPALIKAEPNREARTIERVTPGTRLELLNEGRQVNGYYNVRASFPGQSGWIYRTLVRRYAGEIPVPEPEGQIIDPLADPTLSLTPEMRRYAARHLRLGKPQAVYERVRQGYVLAQDARLKIPLWVQYELSLNELQGPARRTDDFQPDTSIPYGYRAELEDYSGSGFDRGHMAPAGDMKRSWRVMSESFLLSNMCPQVGRGFNRNIWKNLESAIRGWVEQRGTLTIITGPIFAIQGNRVSYQVVGENHVAVPTHFYKIIVDASNPNRPEALAFMLPNENLSGRSYREFLTSIDEIEKATGLDFLSALPVAVQESLESEKASRIW